MSPEWEAAFLAHADSLEYKRRIADANRTIRDALAIHKRPMIAFSGGKDSLVAAHLVLRQAPDALLYHWWTGPYMMPQVFEDEVRAAGRSLARNFRWGTSEKYTDPDVSDAEKEKLFNTAYLGGAVPRLKAEGYDICFVGIRAEESNKRARRVRNHIGLGLMDEVHPVGWLTWKDIWATIVANDLPYHSLYDHQAPIIGWDRARYGSFFAEKHKGYGTEAIQGITLWRYRGKGQ